jgi:UDP-N-acetylbacillosamine N-acetyltransferase
LSSRRRAVVRGASGHAAVVADAARLANVYDVVGLLDDLKPERRGELYAGLPVLGGAEELPGLLRQGVDVVLLGVGNCAARLQLASESETLGFSLGTVIHPSSVLASDVNVGSGTFIGAGAIVNAGAIVGKAVIVNTRAVVEHHCQIDDGAHIAPGALLAGAVRVGRATWIGIGATVIEQVRIGAEVMIGAGAVVLEDMRDGVVAYGVPARVR